MNREKATEPLFASILGIFPLITFFACDGIVSFYVALGAAFLVYIAYLVSILFIFKQRPPYSFLLTTFIFALLLLFSFISPFYILYEEYSSVVFELLIVLVYSIFNLLKGYFRKKIEIRKKDVDREKKLVAFDFDTYVIRVVLYIVIFHLLLILLYRLFPPGYQTASMDLIIYVAPFFVCIILFIAYEGIIVFMIEDYLKKEQWLPIINEKGGVHGKIAASVSREMKNKYLHPVVRIALIHKGRIFLKAELDSKKNIHLDYPFQSYVMYKESLEDTVKRAFVNNGGNEHLPHRFIFKYTFKNEEVNRLIYLYSCHILDDNLLPQFDMLVGRWWTSKQIKENLGTGIFPEYFEKEFDLLNSTILMTDRLMQSQNCN